MLLGQSDDHNLFTDHPRRFAENLYVYPVLSRRAGGVSIGVNLNRDKSCNFACVYCQVDRQTPGDSRPIDLERLKLELDATIELVVSGRIFEEAEFRTVPASLRRLNDIALSGDGEPTSAANFAEAVDLVADARRRYALDAMKLVLITNGSLLHLDRVNAALKILDANHGEIWAKLDAGTEDYYRLVSRSQVPWRRILDNLRQTALGRPIVIQSLFLCLRHKPPSAAEIDAYCDRIGEILAAGGRIQVIQLHTIARRPAEDWATPMVNSDLDAIAAQVRDRAGVAVAVYYGRQ